MPYASQVGIWEWTLTTIELIWDEHCTILLTKKTWNLFRMGERPRSLEKSIILLNELPEGRFSLQSSELNNGAIRYIRVANLKDNNGKAHKMIGVFWGSPYRHEKRLILNKSLERANHELIRPYRSSHDLRHL